MSEPAKLSTPDENLAQLSKILESGTISSAKRLMNALHPADIADLLESLPQSQRLLLWEIVDDDIEGDILLEVGDEVRESLIRTMDVGEIRAATENLDLDDLADRLNAAAGPPPPVPASPSSLNDYRHSAVDDTARFLALSALAELQTRRPERSIQAVAAAAAARDLAEQARNTRWQAEAAFATALVRRAIGDSDGATAAVIDASQLAARSHNQRVAIRCELLLCEHRTRSAATGRADTGSRLGVTLRDLRPRADRIGDRRCRILVDLAEVIGTAHEPVGEAERRLIALIDEVHADGDHVLGRLVTFAAAVLCAARGEAEAATTLIHTLPCIDEAASLAPVQLAASYVELCRKVEQSLGRSGRTAARVTATHLDEAGALALARRTLESVAERGDLSPDSPTRTGLATPGDPERLDSLTARETDVLGWMAEGLSNKDIARELGVSAKTVMHHAGAIYRKLRVSGRGEAAAAVLQGRVELERPPRSA